MDEKKRLQQKPLVSRLQLKPDDTEVPHMVKGKFIKPEQTSSAEEDESSLFFPAETPSDLRTAVYRADTTRKLKIKTKEENMPFEYVFSKIHKKKVKSVIDQPTKMTEWGRCRTLEYSEMKNMTRDKLSIIPFYEESNYTTDASTETLSENEGKYNR
ncbi:uncharacterized protein LOC144585801 [Pogona vitticeps]